jgi:sorbose reductase
VFLLFLQAVSKPALEMTRADFDAQFETNTWGAFAASQACAALWKEHGYQNGRIVFVSCKSGRSLGGETGFKATNR